ncbi:MAG: hypothetical protein IIT46_05255, partial [Lachnospiraceae bacterium]|nr:hypothetical protein [Lachnospiraceae bacterium]
GILANTLTEAEDSARLNTYFIVILYTTKKGKGDRSMTINKIVVRNYKLLENVVIPSGSSYA